ncbi:flagellar biosynthesis protein FlhA [Terracidiphilus gabretensis]|uniref:flagellar biosynthesis protein FlhA n=1 Tax=Terracidiphilus gabretensis TaxID=1577687 RepID=UPI000A6704ED|nr:flagellar biosynthesis protein FlhA [Terracidiphilus gabretensis]
MSTSAMAGTQAKGAGVTVTNPAQALAAFLGRFKDYLLPLAAISVIFVMLVPLPAMALDMLLALSMAASMIVFLSAVQIRRAVEMSVFPTLLLLLTLFRLSLNIASSRRILLHGSEGTAAAGNVIEAFGQFVVGGNYVVGFVLFLALIAIQFLVVSHGAVRTAEVTARFTLDALPGKQMAIDADMNAGLIDEAEARRRRQAIAREAEFYGAMDGAARFNQRDSLATILITAINIIAGLLIGTLQQGVSLSDAVKTYTILTVGDGLVTLIPSLLVSVAGGIVLTRANSAGMLGGEIREQLLARPATLYLAGLVTAVLCLIPGLPKLSFLLVSTALFVGGRMVSKKAAKAIAPVGAPSETKKTAQTAEIASLLKLEELTLEIGFQLIPLVDEKQGGQLLNRVRTLRRHLSAELGFLIPPVHISDNLRLRPREYVVSLRGMEIGRWQTEGPQLLAVSGESNRRSLPGRETREPAFGVSAIWIAPQIEEQAIAAGYSVVNAATVMTTHLGELIRGHAWELLGRAEIKRLTDALNDSHPRLMEELVPKLLTLGEVGRVLEQLLRERVSIRDLGSILEALIETAPLNKSTEVLVEAARQKMGRRLVQPLLDADGQLPVMLLDGQLEDEILATVSPDPSGRMLAASGAAGTPLVRRLADSVKSLIGGSSPSAPPVLLCPSPARYYVRRWLEPLFPRLPVIAAAEIPPEIRLRPVGTVR